MREKDKSKRSWINGKEEKVNWKCGEKMRVKSKVTSDKDNSWVKNKIK